MNPLIAPDPGPLARLEKVKSDPAAPMIIFARVAEGETLWDIARAWRVPGGGLTEWFSTEHASLYDAALKVRADALAHDALTIADEKNNEVPRDKLRVDTRLRLAAKWDRRRYGEEIERASIAPVTIQIGGFREWRGESIAADTMTIEPAKPLLVLPAEDI